MENINGIPDINSVKKVYTFLTELILDKGAIWVESETVNISVPQKLQNQETKDFVTGNKAQIISILNENSIFSRESFLNTRILKVGTTLVHFPLSFAQERLWFIEEYEGGTNAYHMPMLLELEPGTDKEGIKHALGKIVERHEVLRSTIDGQSDQAVQIVHDEPLLIEDISLTAEDDYEGIIKEDVNRPFDLACDYPIRVRFYDIVSGEGVAESGIRTVLLVNRHHIASDGWSTEVFKKELYGYYEAYVNKDEGFSFPALPIQYKDYALWQRSYLTGEVLEGQLSYWKDKLSGYETLALPTDYARPSAVDYSGAYHGFKVSEETSAKLRALANGHGTTMQSVMLAATSILFNKYTGQDDIVLGSPIANRQYSQTEGLIGFFVNTQVNRTHLNSGQSFASLIGQVHSDQVLSQQHQDLPFERLVDELGIERDLSRHPIFQVLFVVQSFGSQVETIEKQRSYFKPYQGQRGYDITKFDLEFFINDSQEELTCYISYATSLFNKETIRRLTGHYVHLLDQLVEFPDAPYSSHSLLSAADYQKIVYDWNATDKDYPRDKTIHELFEDQVLKGPDSTALVFEDHELTYSELNEKANQLARYIRKEYKARTKEELKADSLIALCLDRSLEMVIGILAVLKAGGAYVPIDPEYPKDRIGYILEDTGAELVLSQRHLEEGKEANLPEGKVLYIDLSEDIYKEEVTTNLAQHSRATDLAYVIYTSGTTGKPKGVMLEHYSLNNRISHIISYSGINPSDFYLFKTNYVFDVSFSDIFTHLCIGARVQITKHLFELGELEHLLLSNEFTSLHLVPSQYELVSVIINTVKPSKIYFSGEALTSNILLDLDEEVKVYNYYGPTELGEITGAIPLAPSDAPVIGKIFPNCRYYVLDSNLSPVPVGVVGELYIGGAGLSRGYLNNESLTSERFIDNPFASKEDKLKGYTRLYKTGDLVRYLPDGNLEYLGRNDDQVKIRGYRIELGEIEHVMSQVAGVKQSCVLAKERETVSGSIKYLVGYYVVDEDKRITESTILDELSEVLPEYMVPSSLVLLDSFPLTVNGKLDRRALPDPDFVDAEDYVAPVTETELTICKIWEEVLGVERIGVTDDFFKVGGNSILAIRVSHRMSEALKREVRVADVFKYNTVAALLSKSVGQSQIVIQATGSNESPLSFAQERLWFIEEYEGGTNAYHMPMLLELEPGTDKEGIKHALGKIVERHEVLRSTIDGEADQAVQIVHDEPLLIEDISLTAEDDYEGIIKEDVNRPFDLACDYPIRVRFYDIVSGEGVAESGIRTVLLVNRHHIASDGWSTEVFKKELYGYYEAYVNKDEGFSFPALPIQYKDYALWQRSYLTGEVLEGQLSYWKDKLSGYETLALPTDYARPSAVDYSGAYHGFKVSQQTSAKLRALAKTHGTTMQSVMLAATSILFNKYTGQDDIVLGSPIANRQYSQTEGLIGFFVNTQVNRTHLNSGQSFASLIGQVHSDQVLSQQHQDLPFERLVDELGIERDLSRHPIFQVSFVVQSFGSQAGKIEKQRSYFKPYQGSGSYNATKFDLSIYIDDSQEELTGYINYATSLFNKETIRRLTGHYVHLLDQLVEFPDAPYSSHSLLSAADYQKIVYDWNATDKEYPRDKTIHELFEDQVLKGPDSTALVFEDHELTYSELNEKANQLARYIRKEYKARTKEELKADSLIALCLDRSLEMVIGILAVLKAGGAYVPIDPEYPKDRIGYILEDTGAELVLSQRHLGEGKEANLPEGKVLYIDLSEDIYKEEVTTNLAQHSRATDLAYVIYTSGTTGKPKGVMVEHDQVLSFTIDNNFIDYQKSSVIGGVSSYAFDGSVFDVFFSLLNGKKLILIPRGKVFDLPKLDEQLTKHEVDTIFVTTALFNSLVLNKSKCLDVLEQILFGGENCSLEIVDKFKFFYKETDLIHVYGPTENIVYSSYCNLTKYKTENTVPIGVRLTDKNLYVLDSNLSPVPVGVVGELYIGGAGLARGYLNNESLTSERFIDNPFASKEDKLKGYTRLYKTGDLVRYLPDGNLEYLGRNDDQVKIRGYRIELGEIEHVMSQVSGVKQSCVLAKERETVSGSIKYLVGYYVVDEDKRITESTILDNLSSVLPEYMVPSSLVLLDSFPLTVNGKLDRRALPDPDFVDAEGYVAPVTELEVRLSEIYAGVLGLEIDQISIHENFFRMGGNSILSLLLKNKLSELVEFKDIGVADLFKYNSIHSLIESIQADSLTTYKLQSSRLGSHGHEMAIIGASGAFSGVNNLAEFWQLIAGQKEGIKFYGKEDFSELGLDESLLEYPDYVPVVGKVDGIDLFDPMFWNISPNEAKLLNPQIRKFIEHSWFALESSGYAHKRKDHNIAVFAGSGSDAYYQSHVLNGESAGEIDIWEASTSNIKDALATKTAFFLGLSGPAHSINTACSTGLVSVVEACQNLLLGTCDMALAGGVSLLMPDQAGYVYQEGMILSKDGHCRTFDKDASGTIGGSGVGVVLLKRLDDAIKDEDHILGVIKGYATNNDGGRKTGYTAPSVIGQSECIINAQRMAGVSSEQIDYVECHGTATNLGDPIEVQALREAFEFNHPKVSNSKHKTILGAVKANIGHANSAAGTAGLIKVCSMLEHNMIPGQVNFSVANPELQLDQTNFEILKENREWLPDAGRQRLAGVSSFGIGGTNAHVIIGDYIPDGLSDDREGDSEEVLLPYVIPLSAKSRQSLEAYKESLLAYLQKGSAGNTSLRLVDVVSSLQERREQFTYRSACSASSIEELIDKLQHASVYGQAPFEGSNKVVFMFPGQGGQHFDMAKGLYDTEEFFKNTVDKCIGLANEHLDVDLQEVMYPAGATSEYDINQTEWSQVSLFVIEYSLAKYLEHLGVKADGYIGHSFGEYVAATLSGVFALGDAIKLVISRGRLMQLMEPGAMLAINTEEEAIRSIIEAHNCEVSVHNSSEDIVASGEEKDITSLQVVLEKQNIPVVKLNTSHAYHSRLMEVASVKFKDTFEGIKLSKPAKVFISNLSGDVAGVEVTSPEYWSRQLRNPVQFAKGVDQIGSQYNHQVTFIELGPGKGLSYFVCKNLSPSVYKSLQTVQLLPSARELMEQPGEIHQGSVVKEDVLAKLWVSEVIENPNEPRLIANGKFLIDLPVYQFNHKRCWLEKKEVKVETGQLRLLPKEKWLSVPKWSASINLNGLAKEDSSIFKRALVFIRDDQVDSFDVTVLAQDVQLIVLDILTSNFDQGTGESGLIRLNPGEKGHFKELVKYLKGRGSAFDTLVHASSIDNTVDIDNALHYSFYSLFLIRQHLINHIGVENLLVLTNGLAQITNADIIHPSNGTLVGAIRNINHELPNVDGKVIDIGYVEKANFSHVIEVVNNKKYHKSEDLLAIRFGKLWVERFEGIEGSLMQKVVIEDGDTILVTGGLGGVGTAIAEHISSKHNVRLILVSRTNIYEVERRSDHIKQKLAAIERIKSNGSTVDVQCIDLSNTEQVETLLKVNKMITGIVHTAGVPPVYDKNNDLNAIKNSFKGKVYGIYNIINNINEDNLKFIASTSSLASIMGDVNRIEYCASNGYLDYLSVDKQRFKKTRILSTNWNGWQGGEVDKDQIVQHSTPTNFSRSLSGLMYLNGASYAENAELFYGLINQSNYNQIAISRLEIGKLKKELFKQSEIKSTGEQVVILEEDYTDEEYQVAEIFADVLGLDQISIYDDFFKVGGNSILAIRVSHRMSKALNIEVSIADVFKYNTVAALLSKSLGQSQIVIQATGSNESPLSFGQERLWFIEEYEGGTNAYHITMLLELEPGTDKEGIKHALGKIVERHEVLRSTIDGESDQAVQIVHDEPLLIEDISLTAEDDYEGIIKEDVNRPFDLSKDYPIRVRFYDIEDKRSDSKSGVRTVLLVNRHHIASDGWSTEVFQKELYGYYEAYVNKDEGFSFPALPIQYKDYALWQRSYLTGEVLEGQLSYWKDKLSGYETLALPTDYARPSAVDYSGAYHGFKVSQQTSAKLRALAKTHGTTMQSVLLSATSVLFNKYTGQDDIVLGSPIANRQYSQTEGLIGFFVNTQVNRTHLNSGQSFASLIGQVHSDQVLSQQHQDLPFERLVDELGIERDLSRHPIFQVLFVVQSFGSQVETIEKQRSYFKPYQGQRGYDITKFDLEFFINDSQEELTCYISYATSLFNKETIRRLTGHYVHLLDQLVEFPDAPYSSHSLLSAADYQKIVYDWNATDKEYPRDKTIHELFEDQVLKGPDSTALVFEDHELTYSELNEKANQLARYIRKEYKARTKEELKADSLIALCLDRSLEMVIGILAVLKAGGAYVPIDPEYPKDRIGYILEDTGAELVLSQRHLEEGKEANLPEGKVLYIDLSEDIYKEEVTTNLAQHSRATDLAYVIYTSGTTGRPKGVMLEHYSLNNRISHIISYSGINPSDFHLFKTNYVFDASFFEVFTHLCIGARVQITKHLFELGELEHLLLSNEFTSLHLVPSQYELVSVIINTVKPSKIYFSGEALTSNILLDLDEEVKVYNYYGPTELGEITGAIPLAPLDAPVIGKIFPNCRYYVLDSNLSPVPVGVVGELYIGGAGLSRGYLNNESLTSERFIDNPFASKEDKLKGYTRLYKTGDLVRYLPDGNLEYLGRNDDQVKIRGYRIELGEIEHVMSQVAGVRQVCVLVKERVTGSGSIKYLVGYYVVDEDKRITESTILDELSEVLPEYMVPSSLVLLDSFPLTVNGKLDRRALPDPDFVDAEDYVAPVTETELTICKIWEEVLGVERIGVTDDFFKVGGNSILAIRVSHRMSEALKREVRVADVFKYNTVAALLSKSLGQSQIVIQATGSNESPLSFAQERLWFIEEYEGGTNAYHMPMLLELEPGTDKEGIKHALGKIVERHEVLRSTIDGESDQAVQIVHDEPLLIEDISLTAEDDYEGIIKEDVNRPFDLSKDYPIRVRFYDIEDKGSDSKSGIRTVLLVNTHHIASDGWSTEVFQKELYGYYEAYVNKDEGFSFPALPIQYKDYALWQRSYLTGEVLEGQLSYWKDKLSGYETLALPTDYARPSAVDYSGAYHGFKVSEETSAKLRALAKTHGTTMQSVLLSATSVLFNKYTGQDDIVLGSPIANRQYSQTEGLIGFFVNTQVNRTHLNSGQSFASLIGQVHSDQVLSQQHQDLPFERLVDELGIERDLSRHPIFQVLFVVQSFGSQVETIEKQRSYFKPYQGQRGYDITKFDLEFFINDSQEELTCYISYATSLFNKETIRRLTGHYVHLLDQLVEFPDAPYSSHSLLSAADYQKIVYDWNATDKEYPRDKTIHELFEDQVLKGPDSTALVFEDHELTYSELNEKANQLARYIRKEYKARTKEELKADSLIALCLDRSLEMVIGILAVLKAGGAYVPIDPEYPKDRIGYILEDTGAELVLSQRHLGEGKEANLPEGKVLYIDLSEDIYKEEVTTNLAQHSRATDLAYVIYTSGTTGRPKGVMVEHGNVLSLTCNDYVKIGDKDVFAFLSSPVFDASTFELWTPLLKGGSLVIPKDLKGLISNIEEFERFLTFNKVSVLWLTKTLFENLYSFDKSVFKVLEYLIIGGEALDKETVSSLSAIDAKPKYFLNGYGPTESTTFTSTYNLYNEIKCTNVPIGMPIGNRKVYVLDSNLSPVPEGVRGELYIGGAGLSRGYLNNESLTSERFIDNPFASKEDKLKGYTRLYKTGDLVRYLPDGNLEYLGRNDDQVKIRGYRIELAEIEHVMSQVAGVRQVCVLVKERVTGSGSIKYLVGYYVVDEDKRITESTILDELSEVLPEYMVPSSLVLLDSFPLTVNGKLDRRALPDPDFGSEEGYVAPVTETELTICKIWEDVLGVERIGVTDDFFKVGGDSILAIRVSHRMSEALKREVRVADVFKYNTLKAILENIEMLTVSNENIEKEF